MAKAITNIEKRVPDQLEVETEAIQQIAKAVANHREPLMKSLDILNELNQMGVLDALQGMLKNRQQIGVIAIDQMNKPGAHRIIKNGMETMQFLSKVNPSNLQTILNGIAAGVEQAVDHEPNKKKGLWELFRTLRKPEILSSLSMMTKFLQGMGRGLRNTH